MITTDKKINLYQLDQELGLQGLVMNDQDENAKLISVADGSTVTKEALQKAVDKHVAIDFANPKDGVKAKLMALGLTEDDLKALGL